MKYTLNLDENGFVLSIGHTMNDDVELDLSQIDSAFLNAYQFADGILSLNKEKKAEIEAEQKQRADAEEIADLQKKLNETDYIISRTFEQIMGLDNSVTFVVDFIKILKEFRTKYAEQLKNRKTWRERIEELKGE
jgi:hypothetical protein